MMSLLFAEATSLSELLLVTVQKDELALRVQQVELAACSSSSAIATAAELDTAPLPPVPPELSRLMPSGEGSQGSAGQHC
jgi:hypothetical protein